MAASPSPDTAPWQIESSPKLYTVDQDKAQPPDRTVELALARLQALPGYAELTLKVRPEAVPGSHAFVAVGPGLSTSGKGLTSDQSRASAIMEYVERYSWLHYDYQHGPGYTVATHDELITAGAAVPPADYFLRNFPKLKSETRAALTREITSIPLKWLRAQKLGGDGTLLYPINWHNLLFSSNGLAAGNTRTEALCQAVCELVERENVFRLFMERLAPRRLDLTAVRHPLILELLDTAARAGIELVAADITFDLGVPTVIARGTRDKAPNSITWRGWGHGCHPDPEKALIRALSEYFEGFASTTKAEAGLPFPWQLARAQVPKRHLGFLMLLDDDPFARCSERERVTLADMPTLADSDIAVELQRVLACLDAAGHEVFALDKTSPKLTIPTVRVFSPKMRSVINTEWVDPHELIGAVMHEAGRGDLAVQHLLSHLKTHPNFKAVFANQGFSGLLTMALMRMPSSTFYKDDYLTNLHALNRVKKEGMGIFQHFDTLQQLLGRKATPQ